MKLSVVIAGENALDSAFVVWRGFEESMRKASEYGYDGVELALKSADEISAKYLRELLEKYCLEVSCISTGQVFADSGLYLTDRDPLRREKLIRIFHDLICLASGFGKKVNIGRVRGHISHGSTFFETQELFLEALKTIAKIALQHDVTLLIEPVNRYEINFINRLDEGAAILEQAGILNAGLMADVFHMNIEEIRINDALIQCKKYVNYIHLADTNRMAPGWGHMNFDEIFDTLYSIGYDGWVAVEILPKPDPDSAARQAINYLGPYIKRRDDRSWI